MFKTERQSPPAAALPPSAAEPAAGIASTPGEASLPDEAFMMPAAPFSEAPVRQHAIEPDQCRWIVADEDAGAEALMCGAPTDTRRSFCPAHCAQVYMKDGPDEEDPERPEPSEELDDEIVPGEPEQEAVG